MKIKTLLTYLLFLFLLLVSGCQSRTQNSGDSVTQYAVDLTPVQVMSIKELYPKAVALAQEWKEDALLYRIDVPINHLNSNSKGDFVEFYFESQAVYWKSIVVSCDEGECTSRPFGSGSFAQMGMQPLDVKEIQIDSTEAAQIALRNGGNDYMKEKSTIAFMLLRWDLENALYWFVCFQNSNLGSIYIYIDSFTGDVIQITS